MEPRLTPFHQVEPACELQPAGRAVKNGGLCFCSWVLGSGARSVQLQIETFLEPVWSGFGTNLAVMWWKNKQPMFSQALALNQSWNLFGGKGAPVRKSRAQRHMVPLMRRLLMEAAPQAASRILALASLLSTWVLWLDRSEWRDRMARTAPPPVARNVSPIGGDQHVQRGHVTPAVGYLVAK